MIENESRAKARNLLIEFKKNSPKCTTLHLRAPTLLEIFALFLANILPSQTKLHLSLQSLLLSHSSASPYPALPRFLNCLYHCYLCHISSSVGLLFFLDKVYRIQRIVAGGFAILYAKLIFITIAHVEGTEDCAMGHRIVV